MTKHEAYVADAQHFAILARHAAIQCDSNDAYNYARISFHFAALALGYSVYVSMIGGGGHYD